MQSDSAWPPLQIQSHLAKIYESVSEEIDVSLVEVFLGIWHWPLNPSTSSSQGNISNVIEKGNKKYC